MIIAIMMGRAGSTGFPGKNTKKILGKGMCEYPIIAAKKSKKVDKIFITTDCKIIKRQTKKYKVNYLHRSKKLASNKALGEHVYQDAYFKIKKIVKEKIELVVLLMANAPTINYKLIDQGINLLKKNKKFDSAVTVSKYNMWSPLRARKVDRFGKLVPFVDFKYFGDPKTLNCDRDSQGDVLFADMSHSVVRPSCLENLDEGLLPQKWMGKKIAPILSDGGCDVDYDYQIPQVEYWIKKNGY
jgi:CMP-N-acetylneuraminic acid synthetase